MDFKVDGTITLGTIAEFTKKSGLKITGMVTCIDIDDEEPGTERLEFSVERSDGPVAVLFGDEIAEAHVIEQTLLFAHKKVR